MNAEQMLRPAGNIVSKAVAILLFIAASAPLFFSCMLLLKQQLAKHEMKERLETELLQTVVIPVNEIVWVKKNKEIRIGKELFDVKNITSENNKLIISGLFDHEETDIVKRMTNLPGEPKTGLLLQRLLSLFQNLFYTEGNLEINNCSLFQKSCFEYSATLLTLPHKPPTPPPL